MEMYIDIKLDKIVAKITLPQEKRKDNILAFGEIWLFQQNDTTPVFKIKGFTIRQFIAKETNNKFLRVCFPAYKAGQKFVISFIAEDKELFKKISKILADGYYQQVGDNPFQHPETEINPDDIPF